jgi:hypothetical protein
MYYILGNVVIFMMIWDMMALRHMAGSSERGTGSREQGAKKALRL